jgi:hypothetical protein
MLKPPGTKRLKLNSELLLSTSAFEFNLRRYTKVEDLARLSLKSPTYIGVDDARAVSTVSGVEQGYCVAGSYPRPLFSST